VWYEYQIPADFSHQKEIIKKLRKWIQQLENLDLIVGFSFNHYVQDPSNPNEPDELVIRFQYSNQRNREIVESELEKAAERFLPNYDPQESDWGSPIAESHMLQAYEFGSRCAFLAWEEIENGRFPERYFNQASILKSARGAVAKRVPLEFQTHFSHGVINSLGIPKNPDETAILIRNLMNATNSRTKQDLIKWIQTKWIEI
jgi:hypothetical protein